MHKSTLGCFKWIDLTKTPTGEISFIKKESDTVRVYCAWNLQGAPGSKIVLRFSQFDLGDFLPANMSNSKCPKKLLVR